MGQQLSACTGADREEYLREYERRQEMERAHEVLNRPVVVAKDGGAAIKPAQPHAQTIQQQAQGRSLHSHHSHPGRHSNVGAGESLTSQEDDDIDQLYDVAVSHVITHLASQGAAAGPAAASAIRNKSDLSNEYIGAPGSVLGLGPAPQPSWHRLTSIAHPADDTLAIARANMPQLPPQSAPSSVEASRRSSNASAAAVSAAASQRSLYEPDPAVAAATAAATSPIAPYDPLSASADLAAAASASHALRWKPRFGSAVTALAKTTPVADGTHAPTESAEERATRKAAKRARRMEREEALRSSLAAQKTQLLGGGGSSNAGAKAASPSNAAPLAARSASSHSRQPSQPQSAASALGSQSQFEQLRSSGRNPSVHTGSSPTSAASASSSSPQQQEAKESMEPSASAAAAVPVRVQSQMQSHARQQSFDRAPSNAQPQQQQAPALKLHARKVSYFQESEDEEEDQFGGAPMVLGRHSTPKVRAASGSPPLSSSQPHAQPLRI